MAEDPYSDLLATLKHPIRRSILRLLYDNERSFKALQDATQLESGHLAYHLKSLGELISQTPEGRYRLTAYGIAAYTFMQNLDKPIKLAQPRTPQPRRATGVFLTVGFLIVMGIALHTPPWQTVIGTEVKEAPVRTILPWQELRVVVAFVSAPDLPDVQPWTVPYLFETRDEFRYSLFTLSGSRPTVSVDETPVTRSLAVGWMEGNLVTNCTQPFTRGEHCTFYLPEAGEMAGRTVLPMIERLFILKNSNDSPSTFLLVYSIDRVVTNHLPKVFLFAIGLLGLISQAYPLSRRYSAKLRNRPSSQDPAVPA